NSKVEVLVGRFKQRRDGAVHQTEHEEQRHDDGQPGMLLQVVAHRPYPLHRLSKKAAVRSAMVSQRNAAEASRAARSSSMRRASSRHTRSMAAASASASPAGMVSTTPLSSGSGTSGSVVTMARPCASAAISVPRRSETPSR